MAVNYDKVVRRAIEARYLADAVEHGEIDAEQAAYTLKVLADVDKVVEETKISATDPNPEAAASARRSAIYAAHKMRAAVGETPDDFVAPEEIENHDPAPKPSTGFQVTTVRSRKKRR